MYVSNACFLYVYISSGPLVDETDISITRGVQVSCTLWHPLFVSNASVADVRENKATFGAIGESWRPTQMARQPNLDGDPEVKIICMRAVVVSAANPRIRK